LLGAAPFVGPLLSEIVGSLIPNQRIDRISNYLLILDKKMNHICANFIESKLLDEECIDLFEEGFVQASRAITEQRREHISSLVVNGISEENISINQSKYLLKLMQEINDHEVLWLRYFLVHRMKSDKEFRETHGNMFDPVRTPDGCDDEIKEKAAIQRSYKDHLERLGLIQATYQMDLELGVAKNDRMGRPIVNDWYITTLGKMLLKLIGEKNG
jgi:hypothetical protein